jgi:hypothetical protein
MKKVLIVAALTLFSGAALAGMWNTQFPQLGGASYCGSTVNNACVSTIPAGPNFSGAETVPADTGLSQGQTPQTVKVRVEAFGAGALSKIASPATATIPANTPNYVLSGAQGSAFTITMPASPSDGDIQRVLCDAATVGTMTVAANTGQTLKNNPNAACTAGVGYSWVYNTAATTWYRLQ